MTLEKFAKTHGQEGAAVLIGCRERTVRRALKGVSKRHSPLLLAAFFRLGITGVSAEGDFFPTEKSHSIKSKDGEVGK
jgi:hypothetical protein